MVPDSPDVYWTIANSAKVEAPKTKGSRFIGEAYSVDVTERALEVVDQVRKREHTATHHCWVYRIREGEDLFRYSDDGEPNGSAGISINREIESRGLTNVLVVVTRYYGGTKLGVGGLSRAYGEAAARALDAVQKREVVLREPICVQFAFEDTSPAMHTVGRFDAIIVDTRYSERGTELLLHVRRSEVEPFKHAFIEALGGRGEACNPADSE
ncbi:MAG: YigZ family protein [Rubricoccaceae bacterium]|nr:YigZ family protein [Rubricoccaceae bacterium]